MCLLSHKSHIYFKIYRITQLLLLLYRMMFLMFHFSKRFVEFLFVFIIS